MSTVEVFTLIGSIASIVLAGVAIWLALHHKSEAEKTNTDTRNLLMEIRTDAKSVANIAVPEMKAYGEAMRSYIFTGSDSERKVLPHIPAESGAGIAQRRLATATSSPLETLGRVSAEINEGDKYTPQLRNEAVRLLKQIRSTEAVNDEFFPDALEPLLDAFTASDQYRSVDFIDKAFATVIQKHAGMVQTMLNYFGIKMLGDKAGSSDAEERFKYYASAAGDLALRPTAVHPLLVLHHSRGEDDAMKTVITEINQMEEIERMDVLDSLDRRSDPYKVQRRPEPATRRMSEKYRKFLSEHGEELKKT